ncbi:MAG: Rpn family recombination-promoting nuclease/putative transposase [Lachnospiraceae bacterium]|nr:Rpn family recombination-promoting nuclease/putative transposase [Lachnospiraceae bacterium]MBQ6258454.1 Rpn family recombination-promoting nuclease/putative transposase [Lachnospiraceae bacterium]
MGKGNAKTFLERWQALTITNRYIFYRVMRDNQDICLRLLQLILPELDIERIEFLEEEKQIEETPESRGVRLDAYAGDGRHVYDIEMQQQNRDDLRRRSRYNQAMVDEELLDKRATFSELKDSYVIFLSPFDLFGQKRIRYTFRNWCDEDKSLELKDGAVKVFINALGVRESADPDLLAFLDLMMGKKSENRFAKKVQKAVDVVKLDREGRHRYMTVEMWIREEAEIAKIEGREEGNIDRLISLVSKKVNRNKSFSAIVDELESDENEIRPIYDAVMKYGTKLSPEEIREKMSAVSQT